MFSRKRIEELDASGRIYRKANEQYLPAYQAFWLLARDVSLGIMLFVFGGLNAMLIVVSGYLLGITGFLWLAAFAFAVLAFCASLFDAYSMVFPYYQFWARTTYGSARWAGLEDLHAHHLLRKIGEPVPRGALRIGRVFSEYDLILTKELWLLHLVFFGPTGAGKTKTFFMSMLRYLSAHGSCIAFDPKGELYEQTAMDYQTFYRLDLINPAQSDRWNFMPQCRNNAFFANSIAGMMLSLEARAKSNQDPFWGNAEQVLLTAVILHLAECYPTATPAFAYDFVAEFDSLKTSERIKELENSPSPMARAAMQVVTNSAPENTLGSVLLGLGSKLRPFTLDEARQITAMPGEEDLQEGIKLIDFSTLRQPGTAIFIVVPEGATQVYQELLATFFGQAIFELRLDNMREPEHPCLVLIDEARELDVAEVRRIAGIGRGRGIGMALSYQDYPQVLDQYGDKGAKAILETCMTKLFLPGCNGETANYASDLLGKATIQTETSVDYRGTDKDNTRYSEAGRALMLPDEIRQMPKFRQLLVVTDTAPPVKAAFPPVYLRKDIQKPVVYRKPEILRLSKDSANVTEFSQLSKSNASSKDRNSGKENRGKLKSNLSGKQSDVKSEVAFELDKRNRSANEVSAVDAALEEIEGKMKSGNNINTQRQNKLALANSKSEAEGKNDFMKQEITRLLADEDRNIQTKDDGEGNDAQDRFDTEVILQNEADENSENPAEFRQEVVLTQIIPLTGQEGVALSEQNRQKLNSEISSSRTLSLGVL